MPTGFDVHVRTAAEAIAVLQQGTVQAISLDYNLGGRQNGTGYEVASWIKDRARSWSRGEPEGLPPLRWWIHSRNPIGILIIFVALQKANYYWRRHEA